MDAEETKEIQSIPPIADSDDGLGLSTGAKVGIVVGVIVLTIVLLLVLGFMLNHPVATETLRDIAIIVLAFQSQVVLILLAILIYQLVVLIRLLRDDVRPMLKSTQDTLNTVQGTATFVSERVTKPAIQASSYARGIGRSLSVLFALRPRQGGDASAPAAHNSTAPEPGSAGEGD
jgi:hypothetical protein